MPDAHMLALAIIIDAGGPSAASAHSAEPAATTVPTVPTVPQPLSSRAPIDIVSPGPRSVG